MSPPLWIRLKYLNNWVHCYKILYRHWLPLRGWILLLWHQKAFLFFSNMSQPLFDGLYEMCTDTDDFKKMNPKDLSLIHWSVSNLLNGLTQSLVLTFMVFRKCILVIWSSSYRIISLPFMDLAKCLNNYWMYCVTTAFVPPLSQKYLLIH